MKIESWSASDIGRVRRSNEDSIGHFPDAGLFIVADGMGGHAAGEVASRMAVDVIAQALRDGSVQVPTLAAAEETDGVAAALRHAVERANGSIFAAGMGAEPEVAARRMGSTAVVLQVRLSERRAYWAHVGDSRLYRLRGGALALLTADHTMFGDRYATAAEIPADLPHTNVLLQALGTQPEVQVALGAEGVQPGDIFLLCSDGVSGLISAGTIREMLAPSDTLETLGNKLIQAALDAGGRDNASAILVRLREA